MAEDISRGPSQQVAAKRGPRRNVNPAAWGRSAWTFLHAAAYAYPQSEPKPRHIAAFKSLIQSLPHTLPCRDCRKHLGVELGSRKPEESEKMKALDAALAAGSEALGEWLNDLNKKVSARLKKEDVVLTWKERLEKLGIVGGDNGHDVAPSSTTAAHASKEEKPEEDEAEESIPEEPECTVVKRISGGEEERWGEDGKRDMRKPTRRDLIITPWLLLAALTLLLIVFFWVKQRWFSEAVLPPLNELPSR